MKKRNAFTLAEVLITLGIIGIVAAMTLPTLIQKHRKQVVETRLKKFYTNINQAILQAEVKNGDKRYWDFSENCTDTHSQVCLEGFYNKYLKDNLKVLKTSYGSDDLGRGNLYIYFPDGSGVALAYRGQDFRFYPEAKKFFDPNSQAGRDSFLFMFYPTGTGDSSKPREKYMLNKGVEPYLDVKWNGTREGLKAGANMYGKLIQLNNWQIPEDYPIKF